MVMQVQEAKAAKARDKGKRRAQIEDAVEDSKSEYGYDHWTKIISDYDNTFKAWKTRAEKIGKVLRQEDTLTANPQAIFNITKSVFDTLSPAIFSRVPSPDVSRRYRDVDPAARVAALLLERALQYETVHCNDFGSAVRSCMSDYLQTGRAVAFVRYEPHVKSAADGQPLQGLELTEDVDDPAEELESEHATVDYIHYADFGHNVARIWEEVHTIWRVVYLSRQALIDRFGEEMGNKIPLDSRPDEDTRKGTGDSTNKDSQAKIYEIWCIHSKKAYWLSKSMAKIIEERDDPLELEGFFPIARPLYMNLTTQSLVPVPLYIYFRDQAESLNILAERQRRLIDGLRIRGVYDASVAELQRLFSEGEDNSLIPVSNWAALAEKQGLRGAIDLVDITPMANALTLSYQATEALVQQVYDITGVSDILRGVSDPNETATAQVLKSTNAQGRLKNMQLAVVSFATQLLQIKAQIICQHYSDETILNIAGATLLQPQDQKLIPQALQILRNEKLRGFRVEVSSDSMVLLDELQEKQDRLEFITAVSNFIEKMAPVISNSPEIAPLITELMKFGASAFKSGKTLEGVLDEMADSARMQAEQSRGQPKPPPPEIQKLQMEKEADAQKFQAQQAAEQQKLQVQMQADQQKSQLQMQVEQSKQESQAQEERYRMELGQQQKQMEAQLEAQLEQQRQAHEMAMMQQQEMFKRNTAIALELIKSNNKIDVEQIKASLSDGGSEEAVNAEQMNAALESPFAPLVNSIKESNAQTQNMMGQLMEAVTRPKIIKRGLDGKIAEVH